MIAILDQTKTVLPGDILTATICGRLIEVSEPNHAKVTELFVDLGAGENPLEGDFQTSHSRKVYHQPGITLELAHKISPTGQFSFFASWKEQLPHHPPRAWFAICRGMLAARWIATEADWQWSNQSQWWNQKTKSRRYEAQTSAQSFLGTMTLRPQDMKKIETRKALLPSWPVSWDGSIATKQTFKNFPRSKIFGAS